MPPDKYQTIIFGALGHWITLAITGCLATGNGNGHLKRHQRAGIGQIFCYQDLTGEVQHWSKFIKDLAMLRAHGDTMHPGIPTISLGSWKHTKHHNIRVLYSTVYAETPFLVPPFFWQATSHAILS